MPAWIRRPTEAARAPDLDRAYEKGREDALKRDRDVEAAFLKGRKEGKADRKRHPIVMTLLFLFAAVGAFLIGLAVWNGSFSDGGQVADQTLDTAAERAAPVVGDAARDAGTAIRETGREIVDRK